MLTPAQKQGRDVRHRAPGPGRCGYTRMVLPVAFPHSSALHLQGWGLRQITVIELLKHHGGRLVGRVFNGKVLSGGRACIWDGDGVSCRQYVRNRGMVDLASAARALAMSCSRRNPRTENSDNSSPGLTFAHARSAADVRPAL